MCGRLCTPALPAGLVTYSCTCVHTCLLLRGGVLVIQFDTFTRCPVFGVKNKQTFAELNPGVIIEYLFDKSSKKNYQIQVKVARKTTDFKTFIYGRTCTARVQEHVQRCSSRFTSTKFNSCTEIITVRHVSQIWFLARYTVIIVTLTTTTTTTKSERIVLSRSGRGRSSCSPPDSTCWPGRCYYPVWSSLRPNC